MKHLMVTATLSLFGLLLSLYLWLWKIGVVGTLVCGTGTCEYVQTSRYAEIGGVPVALIGVVGYFGLLAVSLAGLQPRWAGRRAPTVQIATWSGVGVLFTGYLTYVEGFVLHAWCRWCLASAAMIVAIFVTAVVGLAVSRSVGQTVASGSNPTVRPSDRPTA